YWEQWWGLGGVPAPAFPLDPLPTFSSSTPRGSPPPPQDPLPVPCWTLPSWQTGTSLGSGSPPSISPPPLSPQLVVPDVTFGVRGLPQIGGGEGQEPPQSLLLFLFLSHRDPFQGYNGATRRLLLAQLEPLVAQNRGGLGRGFRKLLHPLLGGLLRLRRSQQLLARALPVAVAAVTSVVATSTSGRFRRDCLSTMQVGDTPALLVAAGRRWEEVTQKRERRGGRCWGGSLPRRGGDDNDSDDITDDVIGDAGQVVMSPGGGRGEGDTGDTPEVSSPPGLRHGAPSMKQ
ncbi:type 2 DNA topoisomerase 6 subunit B-like, partial [Heliangelus exortis]|uniref:type 2 DNA topoisomerase 6 subunit B-like n=1 Tax=Heliangelus exortis TaxID=472823 RepID=UPI003A9570C4